MSEGATLRDGATLREGPGLRDDALSGADTLAAPGVVMGGARVTAPTRTTVLPRVSLEGGTARLVVDGRDRFEEVSVLGRGGVGEVVLAKDRDIDRRVALKRLLPEAEGAASVARFAEEVRTLGALDHPNIVPVHDVGVTPEGKLFYVMKYVEGETLEEVIARLAAGDPEFHARYTFARRLEVMRAILRAVQYAHAQGYVHRDLKPSNVMIGRYGEVVVMDWGLARRLDEPDAGRAPQEPDGDDPRPSKLRTAAGSLLGTPAYMSPEQARGDNHLVDERSDVYALGVICHELMTLRHYLASHESVAATLVGVGTVEPGLATHDEHPAQGPVPGEVGHFIRHCMAKDRDQRFRSVTAALDRLAQIDSGTFPVECPVTFMKRMTLGVTRAIDRNPRGVMLAMMGMVGMAIGGLIGVALVVLRRMA